MEDKFAKYDKTINGLIAGIILPIIGFFLSYLIKGGQVSFDDYVSLTFNQSSDQQDILILSLIPNMFMFYLSNFRWGLNDFTKGLVGTTIVLLIALILITY
ncbi:MAG: hypothetical protein ABJF27_00950 [Crocinitomicaceae bacterium]